MQIMFNELDYSDSKKILQIMEYIGCIKSLYISIYKNPNTNNLKNENIKKEIEKKYKKSKRIYTSLLLKLSKNRSINNTLILLSLENSFLTLEFLMEMEASKKRLQ